MCLKGGLRFANQRERTEKTAVLVGILAKLHLELALKETDAAEAYPRVPEEDITALDSAILSKDQARVGITDAAVATMDRRIEELMDLKNKRNVALDSLRQACLTMWEKLDIASSYRQDFLLAAQGATRKAMAKVRQSKPVERAKQKLIDSRVEIVLQRNQSSS